MCGCIFVSFYENEKQRIERLYHAVVLNLMSILIMDGLLIYLFGGTVVYFWSAPKITCSWLQDKLMMFKQHNVPKP